MDARSILLIEDEDLFREVATDALQRGLPDAVVTGAPDGNAAITLMGRDLPSLIITDLQMPGIDGFGVLEFVASQKQEIPVIVLSAFLTPEIEQRAEAAGAVVLLEKPVELDRLTTIVRQLLDSKAAGATLVGIVRLLHTERQNVTLRVTAASRAGMLHFTDGKLSGASTEDIQGDAAVSQILSWGRARIDLTAPRVSDERNTTLSTLELLAKILHETPRSNATPPYGIRRAQIARALLRAQGTNGLHSRPPTPVATARLPARIITSPTPPKVERKPIMANNSITNSLDAIMKIDGAIGACLVDWTSGLTLGSVGDQGRLNIELAGSLNTQVVRAKMDAMAGLGVKGAIEDILITLEDQYHLIRPLKKAPSAFLYVAMDKARSNLGLARMKLQQIESTIEL